MRADRINNIIVEAFGTHHPNQPLNCLPFLYFSAKTVFSKKRALIHKINKGWALGIHNTK